MKNYYFIVNQVNGTDTGVCFSNKRTAEKFSNKVKRFLDEHDTCYDIRMVVSTSNYGFEINRTVENAMMYFDGTEEFGMVMPYDHKDGELYNKTYPRYCNGHETIQPQSEEYRDLYVVRGINRRVFYMTANDDFAKYQAENNHGVSECLRNIGKGIDMRKFFFIVDKKTCSAVCFSTQEEAVRYFNYLHWLKDHCPPKLVAEGDFIMVENYNKYGLNNYRYYALAVNNSAEELKDRIIGFGGVFEHVNYVLVNEAISAVQKTVFAVVNEETQKAVAVFAKRECAESFIVGIPDGITGNFKIAEKAVNEASTEEKGDIDLIEMTVRYIKHVDCIQFGMRDMARILGCYGLDANKGSQFYNLMKNQFSDFYGDLTREQKKRFKEVVMEFCK